MANLQLSGDRPRIFGNPSDLLRGYVADMAERGFGTFTFPRNGCMPFGAALCAVVDRRAHLQAELCIFPPNAEIPDHIHPHVEAVEVFLAGALHLHINGENRFAELDFDQLARLMPGKALHVPAGAVHGGRVGPRGAVFLSLQYWAPARAPDHIGHDWIGAAYSADQAERIAGGKA